MSSITESPQSLKAGGFELAKTIALALLLALGLRTLLFQPFTIPSDSMEPALRKGDYMAVSKFDYGFSRFSLPLAPPFGDGRLLARQPRRGDVIVFKLPRDNATDYVKRLIGLPGDRIQVVHGVVRLNGQPLAQAPLKLVQDPDAPGRIVTEVRETLPDGRGYLTFHEGADHDGENTDVYVVPQGQYFFMGDNRDNSADSRWPREEGVGFVPAANLEGRARIVLMSWKPGSAILKPWTWLNLDWGRFFRPVV
ncbi:MAG TPA: signal peptidase I [Caulobacteraceae bacterium]